jgi:hypothetical protein
MLDILPVDIIYYISLFLDDKSLINFSLTNTCIYHINIDIIRKRYNLFKKYCINQGVEKILDARNLPGIRYFLSNYRNKILNGKMIGKLISINDKSIFNQIRKSFTIQTFGMKNHGNLLSNYLSQTDLPICILPGSYFPRNANPEIYIKTPLLFSLENSLENTLYMENVIISKGVSLYGIGIKCRQLTLSGNNIITGCTICTEEGIDMNGTGNFINHNTFIRENLKTGIFFIDNK